MIEGRILKGIGDFYYVYADEGIFQCRAKGLFRKRALKPLAGDRCTIELTHTDDVEGNVTEILERKNVLDRPPVANIDQALIVFSVHSPEPAWTLMDRFLVMMERNGIHPVICVNKDDLADTCDLSDIEDIYKSTGYSLIFTSVKNGSGLDKVREVLKGRVTSVAGPSGVGKSSLINALIGEEVMVTGDVSRRLKRGRQTTRHTELLFLGEDTFIFDSPGFSAMDLPEMKESELAECFPEMRGYIGGCRYSDCSHTHEPDCTIKQAVDSGDIAGRRYDSYIDIYNELREKRRY